MDLFNDTGDVNKGVSCGVSNCEHFDNNYCTAGKIEVSPSCENCDCPSDTMCKTYKCTK